MIFQYFNRNSSFSAFKSTLKIGLFSMAISCPFVANAAAEKQKLLTPTESLLPMLGGLVFVIALILALAFVFKKFTNFNGGSKNIKILETQIIGSKEKLMIISVQEQKFLIGVTGNTISQLGELSYQDNVVMTDNVDLTSKRTVLDEQQENPEQKKSVQEKLKKNSKSAEKNNVSFSTIISNVLKGNPNLFTIHEEKIKEAS